MTKKDFDEIFSFQLFGWRSGLFATAAINFFLSPMWQIASVAGGVNFDAWQWANGFSITLNGFKIYTHAGSWAMLGAFICVLAGGIVSLARMRSATILAAVFAALAAWISWGQFDDAAKIGASNSAPGIAQISVGAAKGWILIPLAVATFACGYAAFGANRYVMFGPNARDED